MSFDAGSIKGRMELDIGGPGGIRTSMLEVNALAQLFPNVVQEFLASPLLGLIGIAKEAGSALKEMFEQGHDRAMDMSLMAEKAGTSVQWFSEWAGVAETVRVNAEELSAGFRFLQTNADESRQYMQHLTTEGKEQAEAFERIGISLSFLNSHKNDSEALFTAVRNGIAGLQPGERVDVLHEILGRGAADLIPLFDLSNDSVQKLIQSSQEFGAVTTQAMADSARATENLKHEWDDLDAGIEQEFTSGLEGILREHGAEIEGTMHQISESVRKEIDNLFRYLNGAEGQARIEQWKADLNWFVGKLPDLEHAAEETGKAFVALGQDIALVADTGKKVFDFVTQGHINTGGPEIDQRNQLEMSDADRQYIHAKTGVMPPPGVTYGDEFAALKEAGVAGADSFPMFAQPADGRINPFLMLNRGSNGQGNDLGAAFDALLAKESGPNGKPTGQAINQFMLSKASTRISTPAQYQSEASLAQAIAAAITKAKAMAKDGHYVETGIGSH